MTENSPFSKHFPCLLLWTGFFFLEFDNMTTGLPCAKECPCYKDRAPGDCLSFDEFGASLICSNIESNATLAAALNETNDAKGTQDNCKPQI